MSNVTQLLLTPIRFLHSYKPEWMKQGGEEMQGVMAQYNALFGELPDEELTRLASFYQKQQLDNIKEGKGIKSNFFPQPLPLYQIYTEMKEVDSRRKGAKCDGLAEEYWLSLSEEDQKLLIKSLSEGFGTNVYIDSHNAVSYMSKALYNGHGTAIKAKLKEKKK